MGETVFESCHSTWFFDTGRMRFRRVLKAGDGGSRVVTEWRPYHELQTNPRSEAFTVVLNAEGTRLLRSWRHTRDCPQCGGRVTAELTAHELKRAVGI